MNSEAEKPLITMCLVARLHEDNLWLVDRISLIADYYDPAPPIVLLDFGSIGKYQEQLQNLCQEKGISYFFVADYGVFCLAAGRNRAVEQAATDFVCLCDPDFFMSRDFFGKVEGIIRRQGWESQYDLMFNLPAAHFRMRESDEFFAAHSNSEKSTVLERNYVKAIYNTAEHALFLTPYTNIYVCHKAGYILCGGYNENFRGYGSEDYEFLLRYCVTMKQFPLPRKVLQDIWGSKFDGFYQARSYAGFRRMFEALSFLAESFGLFAGHMYHPILGQDPWITHMDRKKVHFRKQVERFIRRPARLLWYDWIKHPKTALLLIRQRNHYTLFTPLRLAGYRLVPLFADTSDLHEEFRSLLKRDNPSAVILFNPFMKSHSGLKPLFDEAVARGLKPIVVERGALPDSWYFSEEVAYGDPVFHPFDFQRLSDISTEEVDSAKEYCRMLVRGEQTLEHNGAFEATRAKYSAMQKPLGISHTCFIPLQLPDDMAVNYFTDGYQTYGNFLQEVKGAIQEFPNVQFIIKRHPQDLVPLDFPAVPNCLICDPDDNIHALLEYTDVVICYNSGVGLLTLIHGKPLFTLGNAYYNQAGFGRQAECFRDAARMIAAHDLPILDHDKFMKFMAWLLYHHYSFYKAQSHCHTTNQGDRTIRLYDDFRMERLSIDGHSRLYSSFSQLMPFARRSYLAGRLGLFGSKDLAMMDGGQFFPIGKPSKLYVYAKYFYKSGAKAKREIFKWTKRAIKKIIS